MESWGVSFPVNTGLCGGNTLHNYVALASLRIASNLSGAPLKEPFLMPGGSPAARTSSVGTMIDFGVLYAGVSQPQRDLADVACSFQPLCSQSRKCRAEIRNRVTHARDNPACLRCFTNSERRHVHGSLTGFATPRVLSWMSFPFSSRDEWTEENHTFMESTPAPKASVHGAGAPSSP